MMRWRPVTPVWSSLRRADGDSSCTSRSSRAVSPRSTRTMPRVSPRDARSWETVRPSTGWPEIGGDVVERDQDEAALGDARVRHLERVGADHAVAEEEDVDVDRPRAVPLAGAPPHAGLDALDRGQELSRLERGGTLHREIQEAGLVGHVHRLGLVDRRDPLDPDVRRGGSGAPRPGCSGGRPGLSRARGRRSAGRHGRPALRPSSPSASR